MKTQPKNETPNPVVVPVNDETRAMLAYAASSEGGAKIEKARQEFRDGKGIPVTSELFENLDRRISDRVAKLRTSQE